MSEPAPTSMVPAVPPPVDSMTPAQVEQEIKYTQADPSSPLRDRDHPLHDVTLTRFKDLLDRRRPAPAAPAADPSDQVPPSPAGYRLTDPLSLSGIQSWTEDDDQDYRQWLHAQRFTHKQGDGLLRFGASVGPTIRRDGTGALTEQFWRTFDTYSTAMGMSSGQQKEVRAVLKRWAARIDAQQDETRPRTPHDVSGMPPGHARR